MAQRDPLRSLLSDLKLLGSDLNDIKGSGPEQQQLKQKCLQSLEKCLAEAQKGLPAFVSLSL
jgi:hypothetical protein